MITGKQKEQKDFGKKKVGLFAGNVIAINPDIQEYKEILGIDLKDDSKATEYLGESKEGNKQLRINFWLEDIKTKEKFAVAFFLEDKEKTNKDGNKSQYINNIGQTSWAQDVNDLQEWFKARDPRVAKVGEEELYSFLTTWLGKLDFRDPAALLSIEWKKLMKGNVSDLKAEINGEYSQPVVCMAEVKTVVKDGETKEYQAIYNRAFMPEYALKNFKLTDYSKEEEKQKIKAKAPKERKVHERFVFNISGEYGSKNFYKFKELADYDPAENIVSSDEPISDEGADY